MVFGMPNVCCTFCSVCRSFCLTELRIKVLNKQRITQLPWIGGSIQYLTENLSFQHDTYLLGEKQDGLGSKVFSAHLQWETQCLPYLQALKPETH